MIGIRNGEAFELSGELKEEMDKYIDSMVMFLSGVSTTYAQSISNDWEDSIVFSKHYQDNLNFRNTIDNSLEVMLKGFFEIGDVEGAPSEELRDVAVYDFMKTEVLSHLNNLTKEYIVNSYNRYNMEAYSHRVKELVNRHDEKDVDAIATIIESNLADSFLQNNQLSPLLLEPNQTFGSWRKNDRSNMILRDFTRLAVYFYLGGDAYSPVINEYLDSAPIPQAFIELVCFELDELTKEDFIQRLQKRIEDGKVSR